MPFEFGGDRGDHFQRHRHEFNFADEIEYETAADAMMAEPLSADLRECIRSDGDVVRYRISTEEMVIAKAIGFIRTYFCPDPAVHGGPTNWEYFQAQCWRIF